MSFSFDASDPPAGADDTLAHMPPPSEHVIDAATQKITERERETAAEVDKDGVVFDDKLHTGSKLKDGTWRKRKPGSRASTVARSSKKAAPTEEQRTQAQVEASGRMAGIVAAQTMFMMGAQLGGPEWLPRVIEMEVSDGAGGKNHVSMKEVELQEKAWGDWFVATGRTDFPPGVALSLAMLMYALPRLTMPETQRKVRSFREWMAHKYVNWRMRRSAPKGSPDARPDSRNDTERKDNPSVATGRSLQTR